MKTLLDEVRQIAYSVHEYLGNGYLEKVYENCLRHRLLKAGHKVEAQKPLRVFDEDGFLLGEYFADLVVDDALIVELKSTQTLTNEHFAQILNYLKTTGCEHGLLINFGSYRFQVRAVVSNFDGCGEQGKDDREERGGNGRVEQQENSRVEQKEHKERSLNERG